MVKRLTSQQRSPLVQETQILASGGSFAGHEGVTLPMMAITQSSVTYEDTAVGPEYRPAAASSDPNAIKPSPGKNYQMFWPSWKPNLEPSRVMSRILPETLSPLVED